MNPPKRVDSEEFGLDEFGHLLNYIEDKVPFVLRKTRALREELLPKWVRIYRGVPAEEHKTWPWPGASNLVIQVAATYCDELLSRVMAMYNMEPLYNVKALGNFDAAKVNSGTEQAEILEYFMQDCAYEPEELDLYRVEETGFSSAIRYGTGVFKFPWEYVVENAPIYIGGGTQEGTKATYVPMKDNSQKIIKRDGPHPESIPLNDWSLDPKFPNLNLADFKTHTLHYNYYELMRLKNNPDIYDPETIDKVAKQPDPIPEFRRQIEEQKSVENEPGKSSDNYDIQESWFTYQKGPHLLRLISYYHVGTKSHLGVIYNPYPDNEEPFEDCKLAYDDDTYFGYGFCEMLEAYQREVSTTHNWRIDNRHFATTGAGRISKNSKLSSILQLYPGVLIPADPEEIEALQFGSNAMAYSTEDEQLTLSLAGIRAGVDPASGGSGGGIVNQKKGIYSAQGTAMSMQSQNNRNNLRMSDMRSCHIRMGRKMLRMYAHFGLGNKIRKYGDKAEVLKMALENYKADKLGLVIKPTTASMNREMERQNEILLTTTLERLYAGDLQLMQAITQAASTGAGSPLVELMKAQLNAKQVLMKSLLRSFGREDAERLLAMPQGVLQFIQENRDNAGAQQQQPPQPGGSPQAISQQPGQNQGVVPIAGGANSGPVPIQ
jgi:hypothetical protein